ncbi:MAG: acryloyl-CoA reductase [Chromatiales bacterium]|jgi:NADPH2:quinone reductase
MTGPSEPFRAFRIHDDERGYRAGLDEVGIDDLAASEGEVLIRVRWSSVNYKDALAGTGRGKILRRFPLVGGIDAAGEVAESADPRFRAGDPVVVTGFGLGVYHDGGYAPWLRVPGDWVVPLPEALTPRAAMALGTAGFTAALALQRMERNGQTPALGPVLITGASGGVGSIAVSIFYSHGYEVAAVTGRSDRHAWLQELGASRVLDRAEIGRGGRPLEKGLWGGAVDTVGGGVLAGILPSVRPWGNVAAIGLAAGTELQTTVMPFIIRGVSLLGIDSQECPAGLRASVWRLLAESAPGGSWEAVAGGTVALEGLPAAFEALLAGQSEGRWLVGPGAPDGP